MSDQIENIDEGAFFDCPNISLLLPLRVSNTKEDSYVVSTDSMTDTIHFLCDLNRGGRKFLQRQENSNDYCYDDDDDDNDDVVPGVNKKTKKINIEMKIKERTKRRNKEYYSSLWPMIFHRVTVNEKMEFSTNAIFDPITTNEALSYANSNHYTFTSSIRRCSIIYYLLLNGVAMEY